MNKRRLLMIIGIVVVVVVLVIVFDTMLGNHGPAITKLNAPERVVPDGKCQIVCIASDQDGDALSYNWSATGGSVSGAGAAVNWTAPAEVGSYNVTLTVSDGRGGKVTKQVIIEVRPNRAPTITSLTAEADWILPLGTLEVTCAAADPDGDVLTYEWTASRGDISDTGAAVNWTAPQAVGVYNITVAVKDGHGSSATRLLAVSVATEQPPIIEDLIITKDRYGHCYLKKSGDKYLVGKQQKYDIECVVADASTELSYEWSWTGGEASGEGPLITWTAPNASVEVTITVIVSNVAGNMASQSMILNVVTCSKCTFGC